MTKITPFFANERDIKNLKTDEKRYLAKDKLSTGLFIEVKETGVKSWHYRYTVNGKQERLVIGRYPDLSLKDARKIRDESASLVAQGVSPKSKNKNSMSFEEFGESYLHDVIKKKRKDSYTMELYLKNDIYPFIGHMPLNKIEIEDLRRIIWRKKEQGHDATASKIRALLKRMFAYALTCGLVHRNDVLTIEQSHVYTEKARNRYLETNELRTYYTALLKADIPRQHQLGLILLLLTLVRKSELITAKWEHVNFDTGEWTIPTPKADSRTGEVRPMFVYMSSQITEILKELQQITGDEPYIFAGRKQGTHISHNVLNNAQKSVLAETNLEDFTLHDLRRTASTHLNEKGFNADAIEACLNHKTTGVRGVYNKAIYREERISIMQKWGDFVYSVIYEPNLIFFKKSEAV